MKIYLVRHGEIIQHAPRRFVGQLDLPLTEPGREQIHAVGKFLQETGATRLVCSPLSRCRDSAAIIGERLGLTPCLVEDLREISLGAWEGLTVDEVRERFPGRYEARGRNMAGFRTPGGESFADVQRRAWTVFETLASEEGDVIIVAHGGVNRVLLCRMLCMPLENLFLLGQDYGCVNVIQSVHAGFQASVINCRPYGLL